MRIALVAPAGVPLEEPQVDETMKLDGEEGAYDELAAAVGSVRGVLAHGLLLGIASAVVVSDRGPITLSRSQTAV